MIWESLDAELKAIEAEGLTRRRRIVDSPCGPEMVADGKPVLAVSLAGAGFDVLTVEPPPAGHPFLSVLNRPNFIVTPHVAWASEQAMQTLWSQVVWNVETFLAGRPSHFISKCLID